MTCAQASAAEARKKAIEFRREAARQRKYQRLDGVTAYSRYILVAIDALEMRAETEDKIEAMYDRLGET